MIAGAAMGALVGARVACALASWLLDAAGCVPTGAPTGALVGTLLALVALPLLGQGTRRAEHAAHRPAPTTTTAARLVWLAVAAALGRWLAEAPLHPQMGLEGVAWMALLPVVLVAASGLAMAAQGLMRRRGWARWAAVVAFSLVGVTALVQLVDWFRALVRSRTHGWGWGPAPIDLVTQVLFLTISVGVVVLLMTSATSRDFRSSSQPPAGTNGRNSVVATTTPLLALAPRRPGRRRRPPQTRPRLPATASTTERAVLASAVQGRCWNRSTTASAASAL